MSVLSDGRIALRPIRQSDLKYLNRWKNTEEIYRFLGGGYLPVSIDVQSKWMDSLMDTTGVNKRFIIETKEDCAAVGMIGLYQIQWVHRTCELGIFLGEPAAHGKGYASAAYRLLETYAARYLNLRKIKAEVVESNREAVRMYQRLRFCQAGALKDERFIDGAYHTVLIMEKFLDVPASHDETIGEQR